MRRLMTLALVLFLLSASNAFAGISDASDSQQQASDYGFLFRGVILAVSAIILLGGAYYVFKGMVIEATRGKKAGIFNEAILDKLPKKKRFLYLGEKVPEWKIAGRLKATDAALKFLARTDPFFDKKLIVKTVDEAFCMVKQCIEERSAKRIEQRVTVEHLEELQTEIKRLKKKGDIHVFGDAEVTDVEIVHFDLPKAKLKHRFTALVSAKSKDYFKDEKSGEVLRGDKKNYAYQEFWCFRRDKERWVVELVRPSADMDRVLEPKNVMTESDLEGFAKKAAPEHLREFVIG